MAQQAFLTATEEAMERLAHAAREYAKAQSAYAMAAPSPLATYPRRPQEVVDARDRAEERLKRAAVALTWAEGR